MEGGTDGWVGECCPRRLMAQKPCHPEIPVCRGVCDVPGAVSCQGAQPSSSEDPPRNPHACSLHLGPCLRCGE